jgi:hypothetical protein
MELVGSLQIQSKQLDLMFDVLKFKANEVSKMKRWFVDKKNQETEGKKKTINPIRRQYFPQKNGNNMINSFISCLIFFPVARCRNNTNNNLKRKCATIRFSIWKHQYFLWNKKLVMKTLCTWEFFFFLLSIYLLWWFETP